jgi:hypothetical protein
MTWASDGNPQNSYSNPVFGAVSDLNWFGYTQFYAGASSYGNDAFAGISQGTILYQSVPEPGS